MATTRLFASQLSKLKHFQVFNFLVLLCFLSMKSCLGLNNSSRRGVHWSSAVATWYGSPDGAGSDGGACGYGNIVSQAPFSSLVTGIGPSLYKSGKACGACYLVKCTKHRACSRRSVRVVITDFCPGGPCLSDRAHFDLSGTAFGAMAIHGRENTLRDVGVLPVRFARVPCDYSGKNIAFRVDQGSNTNYIAVVIEFEEGDGDLERVDLQQASSEEWLEMNHSWGAVWQLNPGYELKPPFSIKLTSQYSGQTLIAKDVIPVNWKPGSTYRSLVNYL